MTSQTYPSGRTISYSYDNAGSASSFTGNLGDGATRTYSTGILYSPFGGMTKEQFGTDAPVYNKLFYNSRGQLAEIRESTSYTGPSDTTWNRGAIINHYSNNCWGMCGGSNSTQSMTDNNGNLKKQEVYIPNDDQISGYDNYAQFYEYDSLNRLQSVRENKFGGPVNWQQAYSYDRYGNRLIDQTNTWGAGINKKDFTVNVANNRLGVPGGQTGTMTYDAAGNLTTDTYSGAAVTRAYDAENRMTSETQANSYLAGSYTYNADGQRVRRKVNGVETWQVYGFDGELLAEYAAGGAPASAQKEYGYRNGQLLITAEVATGPPAPTFSDDFNDNSLDTAKWSVVDPNSTAVVSETGQRLQIALAPNTAAYNGVYSNSTFDLTGKSVQVEVAQPISQAGWCENFIQVALDGQNYFLINAGAGSLVLRSMVNGVNDQTIIPTFDPMAHHYWRIRHDQSANTINFETSADGSSWTTRKTAAVAFSLTGLRFYLYAGAWGTGNGSPGAAKYDNFQLISNTATTIADVQWLVTDQLGTPRMIVNKSGSLASVKRHDYLAFGEELFAGQGGRTTQQGYVGDNIRQKFTQKERDNETGLDYFGARYFANVQGRFTSVDFINLTTGRLYDPVRLNLYSYCRNNPLKYLDPDGEDLILANAAAQQRGLTVLQARLRPNERTNITTSGNKVVLVNPAAINTSSATNAYKGLFEVIQNPNSTVNYFALNPGDTIQLRVPSPTAEGPVLTQVSYDDVNKRGGGITIPYSTDGGNTWNYDVYVTTATNIQALGLGNTTLVPMPEEIILYHEAMGHGRGLTDQQTIDYENAVRQDTGVPTLPQRSGDDHTGVPVIGSPDLIPVRPIIIPNIQPQMRPIIPIIQRVKG